MNWGQRTADISLHFNFSKACFWHSHTFNLKKRPLYMSKKRFIFVCSYGLVDTEWPQKFVHYPWPSSYGTPCMSCHTYSVEIGNFISTDIQGETAFWDWSIAKQDRKTCFVQGYKNTGRSGVQLIRYDNLLCCFRWSTLYIIAFWISSWNCHILPQIFAYWFLNFKKFNHG